MDKYPVPEVIPDSRYGQARIYGYGFGSQEGGDVALYVEYDDILKLIHQLEHSLKEESDQ